MSHLSPEELLDLAEGTRDPADASTFATHLATCSTCTRDLDEARQMLSMAATAESGEPSPLFWEHFSTRVRDAIAAEERPVRSGWHGLSAWKWAAALGGVAVVVAAATVAIRSVPSRANNSSSVTVSAPIVDTQTAGADDASLTLLADLAGDLSWDAASEAGLMTQAGTVDDAMLDLSAEERLELQRLLQEAVAQSRRERAQG